MRISLIIPTYNESENILALVKKLIALKFPKEIIIVDDSSPDGTGKIADVLSKKHAYIKVIHRNTKLGLGSAYKVGFERALKDNSEVVISMDADLSHDPSVIPIMLEKIKKYDVVIGSRYVLGGNIIGFSKWRTLLSFIAQSISRFALGLQVHDSTSAFRMYRVKVLRRINYHSIKSEGYSFLIELLYRCQREGFSFFETPIIFRTRKRGKSKVSTAEIYKAAYYCVRLFFERSLI